MGAGHRAGRPPNIGHVDRLRTRPHAFRRGAHRSEDEREQRDDDKEADQENDPNHAPKEFQQRAKH